jgi:hypothetical protein
MRPSSTRTPRWFRAAVAPIRNTTASGEIFKVVLVLK